jgi:hypothetical protein
MELLELSNFASTYYVGTRLLKPLLALVTKASVGVADPDAEWNRWFSQLPAAGDYGTQKLFVFRKLLAAAFLLTGPALRATSTSTSQKPFPTGMPREMDPLPAGVPNF